MTLMDCKDLGKTLWPQHFRYLPPVHMQATIHCHKHMSQIQKCHRFLTQSCLVTFSSLEVLVNEYILIHSVSLEIGTKECNLRVPGIVRALWNLLSRWTLTSLYASVLQYSNTVPGMFLETHSNNFNGVMICSSYGLWRLALAARHFTMTMGGRRKIPLGLDSKSAWWLQIDKFWQFLYFEAAPSEKHMIFFGWHGSVLFKKSINFFWKR